MIRGYYTGCINSGNIGDDILLHIFMNMLSSKISSTFNTSCDIAEAKLIADNNIRPWITGSKFGVLGGGSLIHPEEISYTAPMKNYADSVRNFFIFGTGISDTPKYKILEIDREYILNGNYKIKFPINNLMKFNFEALGNAKFGGLRGPLDNMIVKTYNKKYNKNYICDPGILASKYINFNKINKNTNKDIIGVNLADVTGDNRFCIKNENYKNYMARLKKIIFDYSNYLLDQGHHLYFYSMSSGEMSLHREIIKLLNNNSNISTHDDPLSFSDLISISYNFKFAIATRLHANILINSHSIPTINLMYNCKAANYMRSVNMDDYGVPTNEEMTLENIIKIHKKIINNYNNIVNNLLYYKNQADSLYDLEFKNLIKCLNIKVNSKFKIKYQIYNNIYCLFGVEYD